MLNEVQKKRWLIAGGVFFVLLQSLCIAFEFYYIALLPLVLLILAGAIFKLDWLILFIIACTPFSLNLEQLDLGGVGFYLPTEPLLFGVLLIFILKMLYGKSIDKRIFQHPISWVIYGFLAWMLITSITSEMPLVSLKYFISRAWFIAGFYFLLAHIFQNEKNIERSFLLYLFPLFGVIMYTVIRHAGFGFEKDAGHWVMEPFYKDHTSYGAVLAMYLPILFGLLLKRKMNTLLRAFLMLGMVVLVIGIILSYTRAAWVSIAAVVVLGFLMMLRVQLKHLIFVAFAGIGFLWFAQDELVQMLEKNKQDSSDDLAEHVESISNVSSDASNLERLNRWNSAMAMFEERPVFGWGPGTYQFVYAPFQRSQDITIISTNNADGGNAHSEYLGPLAEQGVLGSLAFIALLLVVSHVAFKLYFRLEDRDLKILVLSCYLGLMTYFIHAVLNNYLDTDKVSAPFWGFIAVLVAVDIYHAPEKRLESNESGN
jgi:putative inorganic carbon (HCO3(-)) transporter